ncbi:MAG TPA: ATP-binding protein [Terriglobales bacterium]|nr:ATP-binding protein [Terriglobales bacterium]
MIQSLSVLNMQRSTRMAHWNEWNDAANYCLTAWVRADTALESYLDSRTRRQLLSGARIRVKIMNRHLVRILVAGVAVVGVSALHYYAATSHMLLHQLLQRAYYIPLSLFALWYGWRGGLIASVFCGIVYIPHIWMAWHMHPDFSASQYIEIGMFFPISLIIGILSDHERTQRYKAEATAQQLSEVYKQLQDSFEQLRRADRLSALGELAAGLAHEIRNPLGAIDGAVQILRREELPIATRREFATLAVAEIERLKNLVSNVLDFGRPAPPRIVETDPQILVDSVLKLLAETAKLAGVTVKAEVGQVKDTIRVDVDQMKQVLLNLGLNAIQAMGPGGTLTYRAFSTSDFVELEVVDQGRGIPEADLERIFNPFYTTRAEGTGMGLSIAYRIVSQHKGHIRVRRNNDRGMTFTVRLPFPDAQVTERLGS